LVFSGGLVSWQKPNVYICAVGFFLMVGNGLGLKAGGHLEALTCPFAQK